MAPEVMAFSSTRHGGVGKGNYASFNINYYCGDNPDDIEANREALCQLLGIDGSHLVYPHQVHGDRVEVIDRQWLESMSPAEKRYSLEGKDAVMTNLKEVCIGVSTADCIPVLLYDTVRHACCAVHAGWRGTVKRIAQKAVEAMAAEYGSSPQHIKAVIGPGISLDSFEVGDEVYEQFAQASFDMQRIARKYEKWHIDLWMCNSIQLIEMGIPEANIHVAGICTYIQNNDFFSARRIGVNSGRIFSGLMLKYRLSAACRVRQENALSKNVSNYHG